MGRKHNGQFDPLGDELRWFFQESESDLGISSLFGAFVDIAMSGIQSGGRSNGVERRMVAITEAGPSKSRVTRHRIWRKRLLQLGERAPRLVDVLWAAYGPTDWQRMADMTFGTGTGERMVQALGATHIGVALLTARLARAQAEAVGPPTELSDGLNRWQLAGEVRGEPVYRCTGPLVHIDRVLRAEDDEHLRRRAWRAAGGLPLRADDAALYDAVGTELEGAAFRVGRQRREWREAVAAPISARRSAPPSAGIGALLAAVVKAATPNKAPKTVKQREARDSARQLVHAVTAEAVTLLARAREELQVHTAAAIAAPKRQASSTATSSRTPAYMVPERARPRGVQVYPEPPSLASEAIQ